MDSPLDVTMPSQIGKEAPIAPPPIPPNPEKDMLLGAIEQTIRRYAEQMINSNNAALQPLTAQQMALRNALGVLQAESEQLQQLDAAMATNERILREAMVQADQVMEDARRRDVPNVDDVLVVPTVVGNQLYSLCAEERAVGDTLFVLSRGLDKGRIGHDVFVKVSLVF
jgi:ESCRT-I complex subunit TSG101